MSRDWASAKALTRVFTRPGRRRLPRSPRTTPNSVDSLTSVIASAVATSVLLGTQSVSTGRAAQAVSVDHRHLSTQLGGNQRGLVTAGSATEDRDPRHALPLSRIRHHRAAHVPAVTTHLPPMDLGSPGVEPRAAAAAAATRIRELTGVERHDVALVLGSGWAGALDLIGETLAEVPQTEVPGFPAARVKGHVGVIRSVRIGDSDRRALFFGARTHLYEGRGSGRSSTGCERPLRRAAGPLCSPTAAVGYERSGGRARRS